MKKICVAGFGQMGSCIADAMHRLGYEVHIYETDRRVWTLELPYIWHDWNDKHYELSKIGLSIMISAVPFFENLTICEIASQCKIPYVDLGGDPTTTELIHSLAECPEINVDGLSVFTDLGLAPGWVNILAENHSEGCKKVKMRVGGLPVNPEGRLQYALSWSPEGLANEYMGTFQLIKEGQVKTVNALDGYEKIDLRYEYDTFEAFYTKGAISTSLESMKEKGVEDFSYQTIRYPGHCEYLKFMLEDLKMNFEEFKNALVKICKPTRKDVVFLNLETNKDFILHTIMHDEKWTAMQKATSYPIAAVASLIIEGEIVKKPVLAYKDVPYEKFISKLEQLGIQLV